jgi:ribosome-associated toxin RatA of RatAB toxin-antitoxin module
MATQDNSITDDNYDSNSDDPLIMSESSDRSSQIEIQVEKLAERQRQITAVINIPQSVEQVWKILTDYESLPDFIPNLAKSCLLEHPTGGIRLEQIGTQSLLNFKFCARVILDLEEFFPKSINFRMVEGDFKGFSGSWCLEPYTVDGNIGTRLSYIIQVWPKLIMPIAIVERRLSQDLKFNLAAISQRAIELANSTTI